jgi:hypothetical protein
MSRVSQHVQDFENASDLEEWLSDKNPQYWTIKKIFSRPDRSFFVWYEVKPADGRE